MDQWVVNIIALSFGALVSITLRGILKRLDEHGEKIENLRVLVAGDYVKWSDIEKIVLPIKTHLMRIEDKLDGKADK